VSAVVAILYEDERGQVRDYPLHTLVVACVADALGLGSEVVSPLLRAVPKKGDSKLLKACKDEPPRMRELNVFALFDADKLHRLLKVPKDMPLPKQLAELQAQLLDPTRPRVFLLERNTETLVDAAADCLARPRPEAKSTLDRDKLLASAAWDLSRASRDCIRTHVPSFADFLDELTPLIRNATAASIKA